MVFNLIVQFNGGFLPGILLLTQAPDLVWLDGTISIYYYYPLTTVSSVWLCLVTLHGD